MPTPTRAKAPVPAWIIRERKRLALKPRDLAERLSAMGLPVTEGTVRTWEAGRKPHPDNVEGLERIFGTRSPDYMAGTGSDDTSFVPALLARIDSFVSLVGRMLDDQQAARQEIVDLRDELARTERLALENRTALTALQTRSPRGGGGAAGRVPPRQRAR